MITIIDYGMGNLMSIFNMLRKIGAEAVISSKNDEIMAADKLILPGVGAYDNGMENLNKLGLVRVLNRKVIEDNTPTLGICLGMQLFARRSDEGSMPGMGWIDAEVVRFHFQADMKGLKIPHMRWNTINVKKTSYIYEGMYDNPRFYFVHSFHMRCNEQDDVLSTTLHGYEFVSSVRRDNIIGVQFHPEKSHKFGLKLLESFVRFPKDA